MFNLKERLELLNTLRLTSLSECEMVHDKLQEILSVNKVICIGDIFKLWDEKRYPDDLNWGWLSYEINFELMDRGWFKLTFPEPRSITLEN